MKYCMCFLTDLDDHNKKNFKEILVGYVMFLWEVKSHLLGDEQNQIETVLHELNPDRWALTGPRV